MDRIPLPEAVITDTARAVDYAAASATRAKRLGRQLAAEMAKNQFGNNGILDVGCGAGDFTIELARALPETRVLGIDLSEPLLEIARTSVSRENIIGSIEFRTGDILNLPFENDSFSIVVSLNVLHAAENPVAMLNEIERILEPGGLLWLGDRKRSGFGHIMPSLKAAYTCEEARSIAASSHLRQFRIYESLFWYVIMVK